MPGCVHGQCIKPFECRCEDGWTGMFCDKRKSNRITCSLRCKNKNEIRQISDSHKTNSDVQNWLSSAKRILRKAGRVQVTMMNCSASQDSLSPMKRCRFGFKGENCSDCSTMPGCQRGSCEQPLDCLCEDGWRGLFCSVRKLGSFFRLHACPLLHARDHWCTSIDCH
jgi:hypothetical protein